MRERPWNAYPHTRLLALSPTRTPALHHLPENARPRPPGRRRAPLLLMLGSTLSAALSSACAPPRTDGDTESAGSSTSSAGECSATVGPFCRSEPIDLAEVAAGLFRVSSGS